MILLIKQHQFQIYIFRDVNCQDEKNKNKNFLRSSLSVNKHISVKLNTALWLLFE